MRIYIAIFSIALIAAATANARPSVQQLIQTADKDKDGSLSKEELLVATRQELGRYKIDANGNGIIDARELKTYFSKGFNDIGMAADPKIVDPMTNDALIRWDRNRDGKLTPEEHAQSVVNETFSGADANADGRLSANELHLFRGEAPKK